MLPRCAPGIVDTRQRPWPGGAHDGGVRILLLLLLLAGTAPGAAQPSFAVSVEAVAVVRNATSRGFSGISLREDGSYWVLDDPALVFHHLHIDWRAGTGKLLSSEPLRDATGRALTRAELNVDAMQALGGSIWFADERGPYLVETDLRGRLLAKYATLVDGAAASAAELRRGFGGLAASRDGRRLYAAFEGALWRAGGWEVDAAGREFARVLEFDVAARRWTGRVLRYAFEANGHAIADLRFVDSRTAIVLERGPRFRRIYRVLLENDELLKVAFVELAGIDLPSVEGVEVIEPGYIVLTSGERRELVLLRAPDLLFPAFERSRP